MSKQLNYVGSDAPHDAKAEIAIIGAILFDSTLYESVEGMLVPEDFYTPELGNIWRVFAAIHAENVKITRITIGDMAIKHGIEIKESLMTALQEDVYLTSISDHVAIVKEKSLRRALADTSKKIYHLAHNKLDMPIIELIDKSTTAMLSLSEKHITTSYKKFDDVLNETMKFIASRRLQKGHSGIPTGLHALDRITDGFQNGSLVILAASTAVGKTAFAMSTALHAALLGKKIGFVSLEMTNIDLMLRVMCLRSGVDFYALQKGQLNSEDSTYLYDEMGHLHGLPFFFNDHSISSLYDIKLLARKLKHKEKIDILFVDYLGLIKPSHKYDIKASEVAEVSRGLKLLALELNIPIIALCQLNRAISERPSKPQLSDLRDSGTIEQDADIVMFLTRRILSEKEADPQHAELMIKKHRNGALADIELRFIAERTLFTNP